MRYWLLSSGVDEDSVNLLEQHKYSKNDMIDFVSREELMKIGIK